MLNQFACDIDFQDDRDCVLSLGKWVYCLLIVLNMCIYFSLSVFFVCLFYKCVFVWHCHGRLICQFPTGRDFVRGFSY